MSAPPVIDRQPSNTVRPADKGADTVDAACIRIAIDRITTATGRRRKEVRAQVREWVGIAKSRAELDAWLWSTFRLDPVGVTAVRNVTRDRGF